ncbi:Terminal uridylyltransferase cid1 [Diplonema papillatum]|nr:Terminal uridylyltransferase cid1 [Diplonema papillatum]
MGGGRGKDGSSNGGITGGRGMQKRGKGAGYPAHHAPHPRVGRHQRLSPLSVRADVMAGAREDLEGFKAGEFGCILMLDPPPAATGQLFGAGEAVARAVAALRDSDVEAEESSPANRNAIQKDGHSSEFVDVEILVRHFDRRPFLAAHGTRVRRLRDVDLHPGKGSLFLLGGTRALCAAAFGTYAHSHDVVVSSCRVQKTNINPREMLSERFRCLDLRHFYRHLEETDPHPISFSDYDEHVRKVGKSIATQTVKSIREGSTTESIAVLHETVRALESMVREAYHDAALYVFGSSTTGLAETTSDLDVACDPLGRGNYMMILDHESEIVQKVARVFKDRPEGKFSHFQVIATARVPIIQNTPPRGFPNDNPPFTSPFDLSFRLRGIVNSHLLRNYFVDPAARIAAITVKSWSKAAGINNPKIGYLSSYAVTIMFVHFMLRCGYSKFLDPASLTNKKLPTVAPPHKVPEETDELHLRVGFLLGGFFWFYGSGSRHCWNSSSPGPDDSGEPLDFASLPLYSKFCDATVVPFRWDTDVATLSHPGVWTKQEQGWFSPTDCGKSASYILKNYHLAVHDPYEMTDESGLNCARNLNLRKYWYVRIAFRLAWIGLRRGQTNLRQFRIVGEAPLRHPNFDDDDFVYDDEDQELLDNSPELDEFSVQPSSVASPISFETLTPSTRSTSDVLYETPSPQTVPVPQQATRSYSDSDDDSDDERIVARPGDLK